MKSLFTLTVLVLALAASVLSGTYESLNGNFHFQYPDDWQQVDYNTVDLFLRRSGANQAMFNYEAVFAPIASNPFFANNYLTLTLDKRDGMNREQIDSALFVLGENFEHSPRGESITKTLTNLKPAEPKVDMQRKIATVMSEVVQEDGTILRNLVFIKYYDGGVASFYFYSPDSLFEQSKDSFLEMVNSFTTGELKKSTDLQPVKVADLDDRLTGEGEEEEGYNDGPPVVIWISLAVVILILIVARAKKRKRE